MEIKTGMIVLFKDGWYKVTKATKNTCNLGSVFGRTLCHKSVPKSEVKEDEAAWYENWSKSDAYRCM